MEVEVAAVVPLVALVVAGGRVVRQALAAHGTSSHLPHGAGRHSSQSPLHNSGASRNGRTDMSEPMRWAAP